MASQIERDESSGSLSDNNNNDKDSREKQVTNPWPHLNDFFSFTSMNGDQIILNCKLCLPKTVNIKAHTSSFNNLKQHIKRSHSSQFDTFEEKIRKGSSRGKSKKIISIRSSEESSTDNNGSTSAGSVLSPPSKRHCQQSINEAFQIVTSVKNVSQNIVDQRIVEFVVENMLPLQVVESTSFEKLVKTLNPNKDSISRRTLGRRISSLYFDLKQYLIK